MRTAMKKALRGLKDTMRYSADLIAGRWHCPECGWSCHWSYRQLAERGKPTCDECGTDPMEWVSRALTHYEDIVHAREEVGTGMGLVVDDENGIYGRFRDVSEAWRVARSMNIGEGMPEDATHLDEDGYALDEPRRAHRLSHREVKDE